MKLFFNFISLLFLLVLRPSLKCSPSPVLTVQRCASSRRTETCRRRSPSQEFSISTSSLPLHFSKRFHSCSFLCLSTPHSTIFCVIFHGFIYPKSNIKNTFFGCCFLFSFPLLSLSFCNIVLFSLYINNTFISIIWC